MQKPGQLAKMRLAVLLGCLLSLSLAGCSVNRAAVLSYGWHFNYQPLCCERCGEDVENCACPAGPVNAVGASLEGGPGGVGGRPPRREHAARPLPPADGPEIGRFHPVPTRPVFPPPATPRPTRRSMEFLPRPDVVRPVPERGEGRPDDIDQKEQREQREELEMENLPFYPY